MNQGLFITLEGPEGSGKSTQAARLADRLRAAGRKVLQAREPGGTVIGERVRDLLQHDEAGEALVPEAELFLFAASRAQLVRSVIAPALREGCDVLCDRFADSTVAYQGYGRGFDVEKIVDVNALAVADVNPALTLLLDVDAETGMARVETRPGDAGPDRFEREALEFHRRVRAGYLEMAARWPGRFVVIDAGRGVDAVERDAWDAVQARLAGAQG